MGILKKRKIIIKLLTDLRDNFGKIVDIILSKFYKIKKKILWKFHENVNITFETILKRKID